MARKLNPVARWLKETGRSQHELAALVGVNVSTICRWAAGRVPRMQQAKAMEEKTGGQIPVAAWME